MGLLEIYLNWRKKMYKKLFFTLILGTLLAQKVYAGPVSKHFDSKEFSCKCCGETKINIELILALEKLRVLVNRPVIITSGYRCSLHNTEVGGAKYSQHVMGNAVDIKIKGMLPSEVAKLAKQCGFTWTKVYATWTHCDVRTGQVTKEQAIQAVGDILRLTKKESVQK